MNCNPREMHIYMLSLAYSHDSHANSASADLMCTVSYNRQSYIDWCQSDMDATASSVIAGSDAP